MRPLLALLVLAAVGCTPPADEAPAPAPIEEMAPAPDGPDTEVSYEAVVGRPTGLTVIGSDGAETALDLGTPYQEIADLAAATLGAWDDEDPNAECPAGAVRTVAWASGLELLFSTAEADAPFVGWRMSGDDERLQTAEGVQLGTPVDLLETTAGFSWVEDSTLGDEFMIEADGDVMVGFTSGDLETGGLVNEIAAGLTCYAR